MAPAGDWLADAEVGAAAAVYPEAALVDAPGVAANAGRAADLANELGVAAVADVTPVSFAVVGGAGDSLALLALLPSVAVAIATGGELGAASAIDPEAAVVVAPGAVLDAWAAADLADELDAAAGVYVAVVALSVIGGAGDGLTLALLLVAGAVASGGELSTASAIDPEAAVVVAPGVVLDAWAAADLADELDAAAGIDVAVVALSVIGGAGDGLGVGALAIGALLQLRNGCGGWGRGMRGDAQGDDCCCQEELRSVGHRILGQADLVS